MLTGLVPGRGAEVFGKGEVSCIALYVFSIVFVVKVYSRILGVILKTKRFWVSFSSSGYFVTADTKNRTVFSPV